MTASPSITRGIRSVFVLGHTKPDFTNRGGIVYFPAPTHHASTAFLATEVYVKSDQMVAYVIGGS